MTRSRTVVLVPLAAACALAGIALGPVYGFGATIAPAVGAALVAVGTSVAWQHGRRPVIASSFVVSLAVFFVFCSAVLYTGESWFGVPSPTTLRLTAHGLVDGWARVLSTTMPAPRSAELLVFLVALVWLAAFVGTETALRSTSPLAPLAAPVMAFALALMFGAAGARSEMGVAVLLLALCGLVAAARAREAMSAGFAPGDHGTGAAARARGIGALLMTAAVVAIVTATGAVAAAALPRASKPFDLHDHRLQPAAPVAAVNPLDLVAAAPAAGQADDPVLFRAHVEPAGASNAGRWQLAVLDRFDGTRWFASAVYDGAGRAVPSDPTMHTPTDDIVERVVVDALPGYWLPTIGRPATIDSDLERFDPTTGVLVTTRPTLQHTRYTVHSRVLRPTDDLADRFENASPGGDAAATKLPPGLPSQGALATTAASAQTSGSAFEVLRNLTGSFARAGFRRTYDALPGHSYARLEQFMQEKSGSPEQFATAFAVMARYLGYPARVVVGFDDGARDPATGDVIERAHDLTAWPEVQLADLGWVPFSPDPATSGGAATPPPDPVQRQQERAPAPDPRLVGAPRGHVQAALPNRHRNVLGTVLPAGVAIVLLLGAGVLVVLRAVASRRSRRRRRATVPRDRVLGAWYECVDRLAFAGVRPSRSMSARDIVRAGCDRLDRVAWDDLKRLALLVNGAGFSDVDASESDAAEAWRLADSLGRVAVAVTPWRRRMRARFDPRSPARAR